MKGPCGVSSAILILKIKFFEKSSAYIWEPTRNHFSKVNNISAVDISLLKGMDQEIKEVKLNTFAFLHGKLANNVLV